MKMVVEVLVEYDYIAKEPDELSIKRGDVIREVVCRKGGWWEGCLGNRRGVFPDNYVKLLDHSETPVTLRSKFDSHRIRKCRVVFSYRPAHEDELPLSVDDVVNIIGEEEEGWWRGMLHGREGVFPSNFVEEIAVKGKSNKSGSRESLNDFDADLMVKSPVLPPKPERLFEVKYAYSAENEDELTLSEGDVITLISRDGQDPGWWRGELNGRVGVFPDNFVIPLQNKSEQRVASVASGNAVANKQQLECMLEHEAPTTVLPINIKPSHIVQQRKSFEQKPDTTPQSADNSVKGTTPPVLGKKPVVPKKSPSGSGTGGLFAGIKKKLADAVDGAASSKSSSKDSKSSFDDGIAPGDNTAFDQVERDSILPDVRASRAKAPRRRPPSVAFKDSTPPPSSEPQLTNGNAVVTSDTTALTSSVVSSSSGGSLDMLPELDTVSADAAMTEPESGQPQVAVRPKVREWEKHRAPWLAEMKASQAKRTSTSPGPEKRPAKQEDVPVTAVRTSKDGVMSSSSSSSVPQQAPTSPQRASVPANNSNQSYASPSAAVVTQSPPNTSPATLIDMSRSMPALSGVLKPAEVVVDKPMLRSQHQPSNIANSIVSAAIRTSLPLAIEVKQQKAGGQQPAATTPPPQTCAVTKVTLPPKPLVHSPIAPNADVAAACGDNRRTETAAQHDLITELLERLNRLEKESQMSRAAIDDLRGKLQVETDLRRLLQAELDKVSRCVMQV